TDRPDGRAGTSAFVANRSPGLGNSRHPDVANALARRSAVSEAKAITNVMLGSRAERGRRRRVGDACESTNAGVSLRWCTRAPGRGRRLPSLGDRRLAWRRRTRSLLRIEL